MNPIQDDMGWRVDYGKICGKKVWGFLFLLGLVWQLPSLHALELKHSDFYLQPIWHIL